MEAKDKNTQKIPESIKAKLDALFNLNKKRKSAVEKLAKSILAKEIKTEDNKNNLAI